MPQDSVQQAIIRGALARFPPNVSNHFNDQSLTLSGVEILQIRDVLQEFVRVPAEPTPGDSLGLRAPRAPKQSVSKKSVAQSAKLKKRKKR